MICVASVIPITSTGTEESSPLWPLPSCPLELLPQHLMVPVCRSAQVCLRLVVIVVASVMPITSTGTGEESVVPLPSCPSLLLPQHVMVPVWRSAQVCPELSPLPAVMAMALFGSSFCE